MLVAKNAEQSKAKGLFGTNEDLLALEDWVCTLHRFVYRVEHSPVWGFGCKTTYDSETLAYV